MTKDEMQAVRSMLDHIGKHGVGATADHIGIPRAKLSNGLTLLRKIGVNVPRVQTVSAEGLENKRKAGAKARAKLTEYQAEFRAWLHDRKQQQQASL